MNAPRVSHMVLTENQRELIARSLKVASEVFNSDAHDAAANARVADLFDRQCREARDLAQVIADAESVTVNL